MASGAAIPGIEQRCYGGSMGGFGALYYSALTARDTAHAERFADVPGAKIVAVADTSDHDCLRKIVAEGRFPDILAEFFDA